MKYLLIFAAVFVTLSLALGLVQETDQPNSSSSDFTEMVEEGGKIIDVNISDGVSSSSIQD